MNQAIRCLTMLAAIGGAAVAKDQVVADATQAYYVVSIIVSIIGTVATIATFFWKLGGIQAILKVLSEGKGPVCVHHSDQIEDHERRIHELEHPKRRRS